MKIFKIIKYLLFCFIILIMGLHIDSILLAQDAPPKTNTTDSLNNSTKTENLESKPETTPAASQGMKIYKDPKTGKFVDSPPENITEAVPGEIDEGISQSFEGLKEEKVNKPGGGYMLDMKGRFQQYQRATIDDKGNLSIECTSVPPAASETKSTNAGQPSTSDTKE